MNIIEKLGISKGPWKLTDSKYDDNRVVDSDNETVCAYSYVFPECSIPIDDEDMRLISTAPEMLDNLISMILYYESLGWGSNEVNMNIWKYLAEKATGRTWQEIKDLL